MKNELPCWNFCDCCLKKGLDVFFPCTPQCKIMAHHIKLSSAMARNCSRSFYHHSWERWFIDGSVEILGAKCKLSKSLKGIRVMTMHGVVCHWTQDRGSIDSWCWLLFTFWMTHSCTASAKLTRSTSTLKLCHIAIIIQKVSLTLMSITLSRTRALFHNLLRAILPNFHVASSSLLILEKNM